MASPTALVIAAAVLAGIAVALILHGFDLPYPLVSVVLSGIAAAIFTWVLVTQSDS